VTSLIVAPGNGLRRFFHAASAAVSAVLPTSEYLDQPVLAAPMEPARFVADGLDASLFHEYPPRPAKTFV
jgi:hypothetical protein